MKLLVIRHGESEADLLDVHEGRADFELTKRGHRQTMAMSRYVKERYTLDRIYHSTLKRAAQTAQHLADATGAPLVPDANLMEFNNGLLAGLKHDVANAKYPRLSVPLHEAVYEQESALAFRARAEYALSKILSENDGNQTVAVVSHGGLINQLHRAFLRLPVDAEISFPTGDAGIHEWRASGRARAVIFANFVSSDL